MLPESYGPENNRYQSGAINRKNILNELLFQITRSTARLMIKMMFPPHEIRTFSYIRRGIFQILFKCTEVRDVKKKKSPRNH